MRHIVVLGCTGSVGTQALEVIRNHRDDYRVLALAAGRNESLLAEQAAEFDVEIAHCAADKPELLSELAALPDADVVLNAVVGFAGLPATLAALDAGTRLALANKESLIAGGPVVAAARAKSGAEIVPVDSEHSAIYQAMRAGAPAEVRRVVLTASGGPFRGLDTDQLARVTVADALRHPTWDMGPKITIDSSTLMNKGLEVIEAHELFGTPFDAIEVVVHPQSIVHGMVEFSDGATIAQLSLPDMRLPIGLALADPDRLDEPFGAIDWTGLGSLTFEAPDVERFPLLRVAYEAGRAGGDAPAVLSAANEVAVAAFLDGRVSWTDIAAIVERVLDAGTGDVSTVDDVLEADRRARERADAAIARSSAA